MQEQDQSYNLKTLFMILDYDFDYASPEERRRDYKRFLQRIRLGQGNARYKPDLSCCLLIELLCKFCVDFPTYRVVGFLRREFVELEEKTKLIYYISGRPRVLETVLFHCRRMKFDLWGIWNNSGELRSCFNILSTCVLVENVRSVEVLLKYGFQFSATESTFYSLCGRFLRLTYSGERVASRNVEEHLIQNPRRRRLQLALILFYLFTRSAQLNHKSRRCLRLMWSAIEDPFFSDRELYDILSPVMEEHFQQRFKQLCNDCRDRGDLESEGGPRDLKHLARCAVRKNLAQNFMLPIGINELPLPRILKRYLLLDL
ncbi:uncharacterized protein LOC129960709 [Argiope bruennichi]|uniref:SOCS box domain-containing protein n=1 Tax=Argiope bruennichi TaxID=94029 RepID=A0A8T0FM43_ARGBR|nr:uncharacterized protein LOC129960709 [Argiope bruennichi]KAF8790639.1 hypothetical protein HNY73_005629 [Argiope bruennichi]